MNILFPICSRYKIDSEISQSLLELTIAAMSHRVVTIFHRGVRDVNIQWQF
jgi:hypothetical protein